jgi:protein subunit release factor B
MKQLLFTIHEKDFDVQTFCSGGPGGQNQNKRYTGVRIVHKPSGAVGESREERSQHQNKRLALQRLSKTVKFKMWLSKMLYELDMGKTIDELVDEQMKPENISVETVDSNGRWAKE